MREVTEGELLKGDRVRIEDGPDFIEFTVAGNQYGNSWGRMNHDYTTTWKTAGGILFQFPGADEGKAPKIFLLGRAEPQMIGDVVEVAGKTYTRVRGGAAVDACWFGVQEGYTLSWIMMTSGVNVDDVKIVRSGR